MPKSLILYHANCADGFCAAWVAWLKFGDNAEYVPVQYSQEPPDVTGRDVYILDFSYKVPEMLGLIDKAERIICLDHHKTAEKELESFASKKPFNFNETEPQVNYSYFDMTKSGGRLAWEHFFPNQEPPFQVLYTEDRDLWNWKLPKSREVSDAISSYPFDFQIWNCFDKDTLMSEGITIGRYKKQLIDAAVKTAVEINLDGYLVPCTNATVLQSEIGEQLSKDKPFSATFFIRSDGKRVWSLRSQSLDVSAIAKSHGGGGHRNAAGFTE